MLRILLGSLILFSFSATEAATSTNCALGLRAPEAYSKLLEAWELVDSRLPVDPRRVPYWRSDRPEFYEVGREPRLLVWYEVQSNEYEGAFDVRFLWGPEGVRVRMLKWVREEIESWLIANKGNVSDAMGRVDVDIEIEDGPYGIPAIVVVVPRKSAKRWSREKVLERIRSYNEVNRTAGELLAGLVEWRIRGQRGDWERSGETRKATRKPRRLHHPLGM